VERVVSKLDYMIIVVNTQENPEKEKRRVRHLTSGLVDGLIIASTFTDYKLIQNIIPHNFPILFLDRKPQNCIFDSVVISNFNAVYTGVQVLIQRGHQKIGCITGTQHLSTLEERIQAYRECLCDHGMVVDEDLILHVDIIKKDIFPDLKNFFARDITAAICLNNTLSLDAVTYLNDRHLRQNFDLVVYSDYVFSDYFLKDMDYISQPINDLGRIAGKRILERIDNPDTQKSDIILHANFTQKCKAVK
jgi:LacI family transcriptional regulator